MKTGMELHIEQCTKISSFKASIVYIPGPFCSCPRFCSKPRSETFWLIRIKALDDSILTYEIPTRGRPQSLNPTLISIFRCTVTSTPEAYTLKHRMRAWSSENCLLHPSMSTAFIAMCGSSVLRIKITNKLCSSCLQTTRNQKTLKPSISFCSVWLKMFEFGSSRQLGMILFWHTRCHVTSLLFATRFCHGRFVPFSGTSFARQLAIRPPTQHGAHPPWKTHMGGCQNYGPFLGPYYNTAPII